MTKRSAAELDVQTNDVETFSLNSESEDSDSEYDFGVNPYRVLGKIAVYYITIVDWDV